MNPATRSAIARTSVAAALAVALLGSTAWFFLGREAGGKQERTAQLQADAPYYHAYLASVVLDGDVDFRNQYRETRNWYRFGAAPTGRPANPFGIGPAVFELPFFAVGHVGARLAGGRTDGFSAWEVQATLLASLVYSAGAVFFAARFLRRRFGAGWPAWAAPVLVALAGPVVYYAIRQPGYSHPFATFWVAWLVDRWDRTFDGARSPRPLRTWLALGALWGAAALARPQLALWGLLLAVAAVDDVLRWSRTGERSMPGLLAIAGRWLAAGAVALAVFTPQLLAWKALYGSFYVVPQGPGFMRWDAPAWSEVLFSSRNGLLPWAPLYAVAGVGLLGALRRHPRVAAALLAGVVAQTVANGAVWDWWGGGSFGGRRFDSCFVPFAFGLAHLFHRSGDPAWRPLVRRAAAAITVGVSSVLAAANVWAAATYEARTVRIKGGEPADAVLAARVPGPLGALAAAASAAASVPARLAFAIRHETDLAAYDRVVGVHFLGELYPGLNSIKPRTTDRVPVDDPASPFVVGLRRGPGRTTELFGSGARILVPLNRRGTVRVELRASSPAGTSRASLGWNGALIAEAELGPAPRPFAITVAVERGVNVLTIDAPAGTRLHSLALTAAADPRN